MDTAYCQPIARRVRDYAEVRADGIITRDIAKMALEVYDVDELGLDRLDRAVLSALDPKLRRRSGRGVDIGRGGGGGRHRRGGLRAIPVRAGMIARTPRGRVATPLAWTHLGMTPPPSAGALGQPGLFE